MGVTTQIAVPRPSEMAAFLDHSGAVQALSVNGNPSVATSGKVSRRSSSSLWASHCATWLSLSACHRYAAKSYVRRGGEPTSYAAE